MLHDILPAAVRFKAYIVYAILGLILGAVQVGYASADAGQPLWLTVAFPVFAFLGAGFGFTAGANVDTDPTGKHVAEVATDGR